MFNCGVFNFDNSTITKNSAKVLGGGVANFNRNGYSSTFNYNSGSVTGNKAKYFADIYTH